MTTNSAFDICERIMYSSSTPESKQEQIQELVIQQNVKLIDMFVALHPTEQQTIEFRRTLEAAMSCQSVLECVVYNMRMKRVLQ